ncbi:MAG: AAA family ATPase [Lachnospiraceae bacterium]|jgi:SpoVK/Ycf46/Vps4 family AAA+-type ATPase|nr:AAA family ATPase [Lachnospiraceae bacterium]
MQDNLLGGIYDDLFGVGRLVTPSTLPNEGKTKEEQEAIANARSALEEAKSMVNLIDKEKENLQNKNAEALKTATASAAPEKPEEPETDPMEDLDALIGLTAIKDDVKELIAFVKIQKMRKEQGLKAVPVSLHLVFTGNPGTGKTTVARILARLYKQIGVLSKGQLVEVDRSGLVAGYVGQTAIKTQEKISQAMGGVLFIDEAYALSQKDDAFGQEAIDTILKAMEDNRDDFVVIVAGYTEPMEVFINSNPGLKSRFNKYIEFEDYSIDDLEKIFMMNCKKYDYVLEEDVEKHVRELIVQRKMEHSENYANAREVRNLFEEIITNQAKRVADLENPDSEAMTKICLQDLPGADKVEESPSSDETEKSSEEAETNEE